MTLICVQQSSNCPISLFWKSKNFLLMQFTEILITYYILHSTHIGWRQAKKKKTAISKLIKNDVLYVGSTSYSNISNKEQTTNHQNKQKL